MRKYLIIGCLLTFSCLVRAQTAPDDYSPDRIFRTIDSNRTAGDKQTLAKKLTALGQFTGLSSSTITFKSTLFGIGTVFHPENATNPYYSKHVFQRNMELDLGLVPASNTVFNYQQLNAGFTYAIVNNNSMKKSDFDQLDKKLNSGTSDYIRLSGLLTRYKVDHPEFASQIDAFFNSTEPKNKMLPPALLDLLKTHDNIADPAAEFTKIDKYFAQLQKKAKSKPLITVAPNMEYDAQHGWVKDVSFKGNVTLYSQPEGDGIPIAFSLQPSFTLADDSLSVNNHLGRNLSAAMFSVDFTAFKDDDGKAKLEIKPALSYAHTTGVMYKDEKKDALSFLTTISYQINKDFSLPLTIKVTQNKPNLLGFLSIQYSL